MSVQYPSDVTYDRDYAAPLRIQLPVAERLLLNVCKPETGYLVSVERYNSPGSTPKTYAGSSLEQCVAAILAEFVIAKLES